MNKNYTDIRILAVLIEQKIDFLLKHSKILSEDQISLANLELEGHISNLYKLGKDFR